jgi:hypothetical protein
MSDDMPREEHPAPGTVPFWRWTAAQLRQFALDPFAGGRQAERNAPGVSTNFRD